MREKLAFSVASVDFPQRKPHPPTVSDWQEVEPAWGLIRYECQRGLTVQGRRLSDMH